MKLPPLTALHYFCVAAKHLSFVKAANELYVTEGAISRQMKLLAQYYSKALFVKKGRAMELSESGELLFSVCAPALKSISQVSAQLTAKDHGLNINVTTSFAIRWLLPKLVYFEHKYPHYPVHLQATSSEKILVLDDSDVLISYALKPEFSHLQRRIKLLDERLLAVCAPSVLAAKKVHNNQPFDVHELQNSKLILNELTGRDWRLWGELLNIDKLPIDRALKFEQDDVAIQAAVAGHGIALANTAYIQHELALGSLVPATNKKAIVVGAHYLEIAHNSENYPAVIAFREWLLEMAM
ncbi:MAG: LysR family glycine cleavage system transcriptional activator [Oceanospirillaceae bacterium]|jgi:LysR family glycine cleavage system transcriptional activator